MCRCYSCQYESEQDERVANTARPEIERDGNRCRRRELGEACGTKQRINVGSVKTHVGNDLTRAGNHQPSGRPEEPANHRVRHEADRTARSCQSESAEQNSNERRAQRRRNSVGPRTWSAAPFATSHSTKAATRI